MIEDLTEKSPNHDFLALSVLTRNITMFTINNRNRIPKKVAIVRSINNEGEICNLTSRCIK